MDKGRRRLLSAASLTGLCMGTAMVVASPAQSATSTVMAQWEMNEAAGSTILVDSSGKGRHGTIGADVKLGAVDVAAFGHTFATHLPKDGYFPGHINRVANHKSLNPDAGTYSVTIRYKTKYKFGNIMQKGQGTAVGGYWKVENPGGRPRCMFRGATGATRTAGADYPLSDNKWHTLTCVRTPDYVEMYVDGVRHSKLAGKTGTIANTAPLSIGGKTKCDGGVKVTCDYFVGSIDFVRIEKGFTKKPSGGI